MIWGIQPTKRRRRELITAPGRGDPPNAILLLVLDQVITGSFAVNSHPGFYARIEAGILYELPRCIHLSSCYIEISTFTEANSSDICQEQGVTSVIGLSSIIESMNLEYPHRRFNRLTGEWVLVSPHRARRPWLGQVEKVPPEHLPAYDPNCYLCPGNARSGGAKNPAYSSTYVFDNDFPALLRPDMAPEGSKSQTVQDGKPFFLAEPEWGLNRVVCFSPRHDLSLPEMDQDQVEQVVHTWTEQTRELGAIDYIAYVQVFENKGAMMGASNPHPHSQIWATSHLPNEAQREKHTQADYLHEHGACLLCDTLQAERAAGERIVAENEHFTALVPFWAVWPFEILLLSNQHRSSLTGLSPQEVSGLADIMRKVTTRYDNLFEISFPYSMGFHQAPTDGGDYPGWHLHAHYYPPLLRSATVRKFMVGFEMLGMPQRDLTPETAAERLRLLPEVHYRQSAEHRVG